MTAGAVVGVVISVATGVVAVSRPGADLAHENAAGCRKRWKNHCQNEEETLELAHGSPPSEEPFPL